MEPTKDFIMDVIDLRFNDACVGVSATEFERQTLREQYKNRISWIDDSESLIVNVGVFGDMPLVYTFHWAIINGCRVVFYQCSGSVDSKPLIQSWLATKVPQLSSALVFHEVILAVTNGEGIAS